MKRILLFIPLLVFMAIGLLFWIGLGKDNQSDLPSPLIGKAFPAFNATGLQDDQTLDETAIKGTPVLVNVWATWCPTCKAEHGFLNELAQKGIHIIGINYKDDSVKAREWLVRYGDPYMFNIADVSGQLGLNLGVYGAPETFLVDSQGIIRAKHIGDLNETVWQKLKPVFEAMK